MADATLHPLAARRLHDGSVAFLEFCGGGADTVRLLGALRALVHDAGFDPRACIRGVSGCSAGGFVAALLVMLAFDVDAVADALRRLPWHVYTAEDACLDAVVSFYVDVAWRKYDAVAPAFIFPLLDRHCARVGGRAVTLRAFRAYFGVDLRVRALDVLTGRVVVLSADAHPTMPLARALWATMAFPYVHDPVAWRGMLLFDGGSASNFSLDSFGAEPDGRGRTLGFRLTRGHAATLGPLFEPLQRFAREGECTGIVRTAAESVVRAAAAAPPAALGRAFMRSAAYALGVHASVAVATVAAMRSCAEEERCAHYPPWSVICVPADSTPAHAFADPGVLLDPARFAAMMDEGAVAAGAWAARETLRHALTLVVAATIHAQASA